MNGVLLRRLLGFIEENHEESQGSQCCCRDCKRKSSEYVWSISATPFSPIELGAEQEVEM
jgi:hypothetical protein